MSNILDFGPIYTSSGNIVQIDYATKSAESGSTVICLKSKKGLVVAVEKPKESKLISNSLNSRIKKIVNGVYMVFTGLLSDGITLLTEVRYDILEFMESMKEKVSPEYLKATVSKNVSIFTRYFGYRPIGCHLFSFMHFDGEYKILFTDCSSKTSFFKAHAIGKGSVRARTELEKINDLDDMDVMTMSEHAVEIMYKSYDPLKDKEFDIELCYMDDTTNFLIREFSPEFLNTLVDKYKDYTIDGE